MKINKKLSLLTLLISTFSLSLSSCNKPIPDGPIKDFVVNFSISKTLQEVLKGKMEQHNYQYDGNGNEISHTYSMMEFDRSDESLPYFYKKATFEGENKPENSYEYLEVLEYFDKNNNAGFAQKIEDDKKSDYNVKEINVNDSIDTFFFTQKDYDYYRGSFYYGDLINRAIDKWYINFEVIDDLLVYELVNDITYEDVIMNQKYSVNKYGMLLDYTYDARIISTNERVVNTIKCEYDVEINRKEKLF